MTEPTKKPARRRARKADGKYRANDPTTAVNEAWEPVEVQEGVGEKTVDYTVRPKVDGTSEPTAGKYSKARCAPPSAVSPHILSNDHHHV